MAMDELLTPVSTTYLNPRKESEPFLTEVKSIPHERKNKPAQTISSPDEALDALKNQPDYDTLILVLRYLNGTNASDAFNFHAPSPKSAGIVHILVSDIALNYWELLRLGSPQGNGQVDGPATIDLELFLDCLRSVTGLNAIIAKIRALIQESRMGGKEPKRSDIALNISTLVSLLTAVIAQDGAIRTIWQSSVQALSSRAAKKAQSQQLLSLLTGGRIVSVCSEALDCAEREKTAMQDHWIAQGSTYSKWVGRTIVTWARLFPTDEEEVKFCSDLFHRSLSLGYSETLIKVVIDGLLLTKGVHPFTFTNIAFQTSQTSKKILHILFQHLSEKFLTQIALDDTSPRTAVAAAAGVIKSVVGGDETRKNHLINWCTSSSGAGLGEGVGIRRAVLAVLAEDKDAITTVLEKSLSQFGDELYIRHAAILQQEVHTQVLLLSAGYVHRISPIKLIMLLRSGSYLGAISTRIGATQMRARFLGMVVGEALSGLVDNKETKLNFHMEEMDTEEAQRFKDLTKVSDPIGPVDPILSTDLSIALPKLSQMTKTRTTKPTPTSKTTKPKMSISQEKPKAIIQEIGSSDDEEDGLVPYAKGSDPEDSDDDPTLVQRNKLKPPVYIRDLIKFLRDSESYEKQKLAIQTAPVLIRRKAGFGTEVSSHAHELANLLVGLQDKFELEGFNDLKLQSMIALIVSQPKAMAPWFARTFFEGDYSLSQRTSVLIALGLSARELAGFDTSEYQSTAAFPSKRLPEKTEQLYLESPQDGKALPSSSALKALPPNALDSISQSLTTSFLGPLAVEAADKSTGPDVLKLQSFTARYKSTKKPKPRVRAIPNTTAAVLATYFFSPLTAYFQLALRSSKPLILNHSLLAIYLQTLGIIVHSAGPSTLTLPQLTSELWDLLLGVRVHVLGDLGAMKGWLVAMASLLEVNGGDMRRLCESQGREVVETREWVAGVFGRTRGGDAGEENEVKMLAAGVLIKLNEAVEKYQALLMGDLINFT